MSFSGRKTIDKTITTDLPKVRWYLPFILILLLSIFSLGLIFESGTFISIFYYIGISSFCLFSYFSISKKLKMVTYFIFIFGIILGTEVFKLNMEQYEELYIIIPIISLIIYPGNLYINLLSIFLSITYFIHPGEEETLGIIEDASELIIVTVLATIISFMYERIKKQMIKFRYNSFHDSITGISNRTALERDVHELLKKTSNNDISFDLYILEILNLKSMINLNGIDWGNEILKTITSRLEKFVSNDFRIYYIGLAEFAIISFENDPKNERIEEVLLKTGKIIELNGIKMDVELAVGFSRSSEEFNTFEMIYRNSDIALTEAKKRSDLKPLEFTNAMGEHFEERYHRVNEIKKALVHNEFVVYYQPKNDVVEGNTVGLEALIRWNHPTEGILSPNAFIELSEETGLIVDIGYYVIERVCRFISKLRKMEREVIRISINISPVQLKDQNLIARILSIFEEYSIEGKNIEIEITEGALMENPKKSIEILKELKRTGISISMDDFGVGYSSFTYIKELPIDTIKLDRYFIKDISTCGTSKKILYTMITLAKNLDLNILAEGVETKEQLDILKELGCNSFQGYLVSKPVNEKEILHFF